MHLRDILAFSALALAASVSARSVPQPPKGSSPIASATVENGGQGSELRSENFENRCGPKYGKCGKGKCCSTAGESFDSIPLNENNETY